MNNFLEKVEERLDDMITNRPRFKEATRKFFEAADTDRNERVSQHEAAAQVPLIFDMIQADLDEYGIKVVKPTKEEVMAYLEDDECDSEWAMDFEEFEDFYLQVGLSTVDELMCEAQDARRAACASADRFFPVRVARG